MIRQKLSEFKCSDKNKIDMLESIRCKIRDYMIKKNISRIEDIELYNLFLELGAEIKK